MPDQSTSKMNAINSLADAQFIWDEYKYRHEHIWKLIFQITTAVIAVSIVPYISNEAIVKTLRWFIVALPAIGAILVVFGWARLSKEMYAMGELKKRHRAYHETTYGIDYYPGRKKNTKHKSSFFLHVEIYLGSLLVLSILNIIILLWLWVPHAYSITSPTVHSVQ